MPKLNLFLAGSVVTVLSGWAAYNAVDAMGAQKPVEAASLAYSPTPVDRSAEPILPIPLSMSLDPRKVELGRRLFGERQLSHDDTLSCASCHSLSRGGNDGREVSVGSGGKAGRRNAPTVLNSAFNFRQFWDGRAESLEDQIDGPLLNPVEMATTWDEVVAKLTRSATYVADFRAIYGSLIRPEFIKEALATYERSLITPGSRFDRFLRGDPSAVTDLEKRGYQVFKRRGCVSCHQGVNVGGNFFARFGVMREATPAPEIQEGQDLGRYEITRRPRDLGVFKVPGLRNVASTAPYFHDGSVSSLKEAVSLMADFQLGLQMSGEEIDLVVAFLKTLTPEAEKNSP